MLAEDIFGTVIMAVCCLGCGALFFGMGLYARKAKKPMGFWANREIRAEWISDIPSYNAENARMWMFYAIPYFISGCFGCFMWLNDVFAIISVILLGLAAFPGIWFLVLHYRKIEKQYFDRKRLDKIDPFC